MFIKPLELSHLCCFLVFVNNINKGGFEVFKRNNIIFLRKSHLRSWHFISSAHAVSFFPLVLRKKYMIRQVSEFYWLCHCFAGYTMPLYITGADPGGRPWVLLTVSLFCRVYNASLYYRGGSRGRPPPPKIGKNKIFWRKIVIFHTKYPKNCRASLRSAQFFLHAPP